MHGESQVPYQSLPLHFSLSLFFFFLAWPNASSGRKDNKNAAFLLVVHVFAGITTNPCFTCWPLTIGLTTHHRVVVGGRCWRSYARVLPGVVGAVDDALQAARGWQGREVNLTPNTTAVQLHDKGQVRSGWLSYITNWPNHSSAW